MGIQINKLRAEYAENPQDLLLRIYENNPEEVRANLRLFTGEVINENDPSQLFEALQNTIESNPVDAEQLIFDVFNVPIVEEDLSPVEQEWVGLELNNAARRGSNKNLPFLSDDDLGQGPPVGENQAGADNANDDNGGFNWGGVLGETLPGILGLFGFNPNQNAINQQNWQMQQQQRNSQWIMWLIVFVVIAIIAFWALKK
jgi:hypothetical protein